MSATKLLCHTLGVNPCGLSKEENLFLEVDLFTRICEELNEIFKKQYQNYFQTLKINLEMENTMLETNFVRCVINDILSTEEYSLSGVAYYTHTPEDVIFEIIAGKNTDPSASVLRKIIELHRSVKPNLYREIMNKIFRERTPTLE